MAQAAPEKDALQDRNVVVNGLPTDLEWRGKIGNVDQSHDVSRGERQKPGQRVERMDGRDIADIGLDLRFRQAPIPCKSPRRGYAALTPRDYQRRPITSFKVG